MQKHIIPLIAVVLGLVSCQPDIVETEKPEEPRIETPVEEEPEDTEEEPTVDPDINDWKPGSSGSTDLVEKP
ncbi:hypothetical protein K8P02_00555 [Bacteroides nordii]|uniref:hypothetical protein n=1 Tax=Bacteroides nordii TaxID=291645 RepID=UPI0012DFAF47|nr:hypothetical protein [Bacteroides nordii]UAK42817.1 hypothetical protein K8P02_00555 [Bacteroides nordii]